MTAYILVGLFVIGGAFLIWYLRFRKKDDTLKYINDRLSDLGIDPKRYANFKHNGVTPKGAPYFSTVPMPTDVLEVYDSSTERMAANHKRKYPDKDVPMNARDYPACFVDAMTVNEVNEPGSPALLVTGYQTAGTVVGTAVGSRIKVPHLVIPHQAAQGWQFKSYFAQSVYNEAEHSAEARYDRGIFGMYTGEGDSHPHVPDMEGAVGFASRTSPPCAGRLG